MSTITPDPVAIYNVNNPVSPHIGSIVGTTPWNSDDASYSQIWTTFDGAVRFSEAGALLPAISGVTGVTLSARVSLHEEGVGSALTEGRISFLLFRQMTPPQSVMGWFSPIGTDSEFDIPKDGEIYDVEATLITVAGLPITAAGYAEMFDGTTLIGVGRGSEGNATSYYGARIHKLQLIVQAGVPPLRHTQRDDLRNTGTNSRQRSLRNTGYL